MEIPNGERTLDFFLLFGQVVPHKLFQNTKIFSKKTAEVRQKDTGKSSKGVK